MESIRSFYNSHQKLILFTILVFIALVVTVTVVLTNKTNNYPCIRYDMNTLATSVSQDCLLYLWRLSCGAKNINFDPTNKWWIQSPQGLTPVRCSGNNIGTLCGAGNYNAISLGINLCSPNYQG